MRRVYPEKRSKGYVIVEYTGQKLTGTARKIWPPALLAPRKPRYFSSYKEASDFISGAEKK